MSTAFEVLRYSGNGSRGAVLHSAPPAHSTALAPQPGRRKTPRDPRSTTRRIGRLMTTLLLVFAASAFALLAVGPHVFGYRTATMLTGSMAPEINPGDVVVTMPKPKDDVAVGDVISYHIPVEDHRVETHRVVEVTKDAGGALAVRTKGDANEGVDPWLATLEGDTVWQQTMVVPHAGTVIRTLRAPLVQKGVLWGALAGFIVIGLARIWAKDETDDA